MFNDIRSAIRQLWHHPGFTVLAVGTLAAGIGTTAVVFSVAEATIFRLPDYREAHRLVWVVESELKGGWTRLPVTPLNFDSWSRNSRCLQELAAHRAQSVNVASAQESSLPEYLEGGRITPNLPQMLGFTPVLGRGFVAQDTVPGQNRVVLLSYDLWKQRFRAAPSVLGSRLVLNGEVHSIVGVMPAEFHFPPGASQQQLWTPLTIETTGPLARSRALGVLGRLKPGVTRQQAQAELAALTQAQARSEGVKDPINSARVGPLNDWYSGSFRQQSGILLAAVGLLLLLACANVAGLFLARATARLREMAIRAALGASMGRIVRQVLVESAVLGIVGGMVGLGIAPAGLGVFQRLMPADVHHVGVIGIDRNTVLAVVAVSLASAAIFGLSPAWIISRPNLHEGLKEGSPSGGTVRLRSLRGMLVVVQLGLAVMLVCSAVSLMQDLLLWRHPKYGFKPERLLTGRIDLNGPRYQQVEQIQTMESLLLERLEALPGVSSAALATSMPFVDGDSGHPFQIEGRPTMELDRSEFLEAEWVTQEYFQTLGIPILSGRDFTGADWASPVPQVAIINQEFVRKHFAHENPLGRRVRLLPPKYRATAADSAVVEIVGVTSDQKRWHPGEKPWPVLSLPLVKQPRPNVLVAVRTTQAPAQLTQSVRHAVASCDPQLAIYEIRTMEDRLVASVAEDRLMIFLLHVFAGLALLLATVGLFGLVSYMVALRTREIGIRLALGAPRRHVLGLVLRHCGTLIVCGGVAGIAGAVAANGLLRTTFYEHHAIDGWTILAVSSVLMAVGLLACWMPARRATRVEPMIALRTE